MYILVNWEAVFCSAVALRKLHGNCCTRSTFNLRSTPSSWKMPSTLRRGSENRTHHDGQTDDPQTCFKVAKWGMFYPSSLERHPARLNQFYFDGA